MSSSSAGSPAAARFDEWLAADGRPRPHWQPLSDWLAATDATQVHARLASVAREVRDSGLTYTVYAADQERERPWPLDALPLIIPAHEWCLIEAAIRQRARLLNALLADFYGPQVLLQSGAVPPALVLGHSAFQRPAWGVSWPAGVGLVVYAADLARAPDGQWWVMADRTQAPSGAGYALSNRFMMARMLAPSFEAQHVQRLAVFFAQLRRSLFELAPQGDGPHLTVLLTPGVLTETYGEHVLLARYLGVVLVEGHDLTVRQGKLWLKTVGGLRRVHAVLRRQDDDYCDPLEMRADSALGVPGLLECVRQGAVLIANALGSGILESGALLGFLPGLAQQVLGEPLRMPSVATWWLGEPAALRDAWAHIDRLVFKPVDPTVRAEPVFGRDLDAAGRRALQARVHKHPHAWIAQEWVRLSHAPVYDASAPGGVARRAVGLRVFAVADAADWMVMPGGLARLATEHDPRVISMQQGGISKDTWVLADAPVPDTVSLLPRTIGPTDLVRSPVGGLTSRAAEHLFWWGRYMERAEATARLLRVALARFGSAEAQDCAARPALLALAQVVGIVPAAAQGALHDWLRAWQSPELPGGLRSTLGHLQRVAAHLRERLSADHGRAMHHLLQQTEVAAAADVASALVRLDQVLASLVTLVGFTLDGMTRDGGWRFVAIGRRIERLHFVCQAVRTGLAAHARCAPDWLLELFDSSLTYRGRYLGAPEWLPTLDVLVRDESNPRSIAFALEGLVTDCDCLALAWGACAAVRVPPILAHLGPLAEAQGLVEIPTVLSWLAAVAAAAAELSDQWAMTVFAHAEDWNRASFAP